MKMMNQFVPGPGDKELNDLLDFSAVSTQTKCFRFIFSVIGIFEAGGVAEWLVCRI